MPKKYTMPIDDLAAYFPKDDLYTLNGKVALTFQNLDVAKKMFENLEISEYTKDVTITRNSDGQRVSAEVAVTLTARELLVFLIDKARSTPEEIEAQKLKSQKSQKPAR